MGNPFEVPDSQPKEKPVSGLTLVDIAVMDKPVRAQAGNEKPKTDDG